jgi:hypothetical protein
MFVKCCKKKEFCVNFLKQNKVKRAKKTHYYVQINRLDEKIMNYTEKILNRRFYDKKRGKKMQNCHFHKQYFIKPKKARQAKLTNE